MPSVINLSNFTFGVEQIRSVKDLLRDEVLNSPDIQKLYTIYAKIQHDKEVGFLGKGSLVGKAFSGCDPVAQAYNIATRKITWTPKGWEVLIHQCVTDLENTAAAYSLKTGTAYADFSDSDYVNIVVQTLAESIRDFIHRIVWFGDEDADEVQNSGELKNGTDKGFFNLFDGFFKQIATQTTANAAQRITISENAAENYAAQAITSAKALEYLEKVVYAAPVQLRSRNEKFLLVTQSVYDAYERSLSGTSLESMYRNLVDGQVALTYKGIPVIALPKWDETIQSYYDNGTKFVNPHRIIFTSKDFLAVGVDDESSLDNIETWYNRDERKVKIEAGGKLDAKLSHPAMFTIAI